jgi:hypothetical protein
VLAGDEGGEVSCARKLAAELVAWVYEHGGEKHFIFHDPTPTEEYHGFQKSRPLIYADAAPAGMVPREKAIAEWENYVNMGRGFSVGPTVPAAPPAAVPQGEPMAEALRHAAQVIELYDDATMNADYMLDSTECAGILNALAEYRTRFYAAPPADGVVVPKIVLQALRDRIAMAYGDLPKDCPPGPPTGILATLDALLAAPKGGE